MSERRFRLPPDWLEKPIKLWLAGAGGTGGEMLDGLVRLHLALRQLGHPHGLSVTVFDPDVVSAANLGRQRFYADDVGLNKAKVLVQRFNLFCGLDWRAVPEELEVVHNRYRGSCDLLVTCVDSARTRVDIAERYRDLYLDTLWLDTGNDATTGQVVFGHLGRCDDQRLPNVVDLYPGLVGADEDDAPSCSLAAALSRQDLTVNRTVATVGLNILWRLLRHAEIDHHGAWIDVATNRVTPMPICPKSWACMGYAEEAESAEVND